MKVPLLTGVLIVCFTPVVWSQDDKATEEDLCMQNITSTNQLSDKLKNVSPDISHLSLCKNDILTIDKNPLKRFKSLVTLVLDENNRLHFNSDGSEFLQLESLTDLQCFRCGVDKIYNKSLQGMPKLEHINLTHNKIEEIEIKAFYSNTDLETIDLRFNKLRQLPSEMLTPLGSIQKIDLSSNTELAPEYSEPFLISEVLENLRCNECGFVTIEENTFARLPGLKELYLRRNKISQIHGFAFPQKALTTLMLEGNALQSIGTSILDVVNLNICLDNNTNELECFLKKLSYQDKLVCSNASLEDIECPEPSSTTTEIPTTIATDIPHSTADKTIISKDRGMPVTMTNDSDTFAKNETLTTSTLSTPTLEIVEGISDAYIGGYLTVIYLAQIVTFILLLGVWLKLKKYDTDPDVDRYAESILNPNPIYKAVY